MMGSRLWVQLSANTRGAQILELAVALPLLVVFVVGIYDFSQAFNTKEKLNFAARDGARLGSTLPTNDLSRGIPVSVTAIRDLVDADLLAASINDCGLGPITQAGLLIWTATGTCQNSSTFTLTIDRGFVIPPSPTASQPVQQLSTHIDLQYPYQWQFSSAIRLLVPTASYAGTTLIDTDAFAANQD
jgi:Flp pilus assembly protein TadG